MASGQTLEGLIALAYRVRNFQIIGGPGWMRNDLWEIQAKAPEGSVPPPVKFSLQQAEPPQTLTQPDTIDLMVQSLLDERFSLRLHRETRDLPVYEIVVAKAGPKIKLADDQNLRSPDANRQQPASPPAVSNGPPPMSPGGYQNGGRQNGSRYFEAIGLPLWVLGQQLANLMGTKVIDKTGLKGLYDWRIEWSPDTSLTADPSGPSIFTAMQEQLGLRLVSTKGPLEVIVIDSVQKPTVN